MAKEAKRLCCHPYGPGCLRNGVYPAGDKVYCWQHRRDEEYLKEKYAKARERRMAEYKQREAEAEAWERRIERKQLEKAAGLAELTDDDLKDMAAARITVPEPDWWLLIRHVGAERWERYRDHYGTDRSLAQFYLRDALIDCPKNKELCLARVVIVPQLSTVQHGSGPALEEW